MTEADRPVFAAALHTIAEAFVEPMSEARAEAYFVALEDYGIEDVSQVVRQALRACTFFPKPAELRALLTGHSVDHANLAWGEVLREISRVGYVGLPRFSDARTLETIRLVWGSWARLCETLPADGPEVIGWIKRFESAYATTDRADEHARLKAATVHPDVLAAFGSQGALKRIP